MINGAHVIILSKQPDADRAFFRDVLGLSHVDVGGGWLIFELPPAEVAVHPAERESVHELYLMCDDVTVLVKKLTERGIECGPIEDQGWGLLTSLTLPGGGTLGAYQPRHPRPTDKALSGAPARARKSAPKQATKKAASKKSAPKKSAPKKAAPKKAAPKRAAPKRAAPKKSARKTVAKKAAPKRAAKRAVGSKRR